MMIDLYAAATSNGIRARIMLEECALPYELKFVDLAKGANHEPEYLALNGQGLTPVIIDHDGPDGKTVTMAQSPAILFYLANKVEKFLPQTAEDRIHFPEHYMNVATDLGLGLQTIFMIRRMDDPHQPTLEMFESRYRRFMEVWDAALATRPYCAGQDLTIADFAFFGHMFRCRIVAPHLIEGLANIARWYEGIAARPGVKKGCDFG